jgi:tetratricopeptide (TPR) repeat protein
MRKIILIIISCLGFSICFATGAYQTQLENAEYNFKKSNFVKSIEIYESLIDVEKVINPYIYYNLANAYYRNGELGKAILNIEKASRIDPRDREIRSNRKYLNSVAGQVGNNDFPDIFLQFFSLNEITLVFVTLVILLLILLSLFVIKKQLILKKIIIIMSGFLILVTPIFVFKVYRETIVEKAVVLSSLNAKSGPGENNPEFFTIQEGKIVSIISRNEGWSNIKIKSENETLIGWVESGTIGSISI